MFTGLYVVILNLLLLKLFFAVAMLQLGPSSTLILCVYIASNRVSTEVWNGTCCHRKCLPLQLTLDSGRGLEQGVCRLLNIAISDLVDEDYVIHGRQTAVSALVFGTTALLSKPGQVVDCSRGHKAWVCPRLGISPLPPPITDASPDGWDISPAHLRKWLCFLRAAQFPHREFSTRQGGRVPRQPPGHDQHPGG